MIRWVNNMKYLKKVILKNFQSHKYSVIEFDEGLNIIVGPSDSGKSAIIRAIKWALYNDPLGDYFIREGEDEASVVLIFSNNIKVKRLRSKSRNAYILYGHDGEELIFEGFGNKVPKEIIDILAIKKIPLDSNETNAINLGEQLEGAFLLSEKGSVRASAIGRLVGVDLIDDALKDTLKDIRNLSINKKLKTERLKEIEEELLSYDYLEILNKKINRLDEIKILLKNKVIMKNNLIKIIKNYEYIKLEKKNSNKKLYELSKIDIVENNIYNLEIMARKLSFYKITNNKLKTIKNTSNINESLLEKLNNNLILEKSIQEIDLKNNKLKNLKKIYSQVNIYKKESEVVFSISSKLNKLQFIEDKANTIEAKLARFKTLKNLKEKRDYIDKSLKIGNTYIEKLNRLNAMDRDFNELDKLIYKRNLLLKAHKKLNNNRIEINKENNVHVKAKSIIDENLKSYEDLLLESNTCPFCLSNINKDKIDHIIEHYS